MLYLNVIIVRGNIIRHFNPPQLDFSQKHVCCIYLLILKCVLCFTVVLCGINLGFIFILLKPCNCYCKFLNYNIYQN